MARKGLDGRLTETGRRIKGCIAAAAALASVIMYAEGSANAEPVWTPRDGELLHFDVFRNGSPFGQHVVKFTRSGEALTVSTDIELHAGLGPLTLYRYRHNSVEVRRDGRLEEVVGSTHKNGKTLRMAARATAGGWDVAGSTFRGKLDELLTPSTHWNIDEVRGRRMLSTENGEVLPIAVIDQGEEVVKIGSSSTRARRYLLRSQLDVTLWYDAAGRWVKCAFEAEGQKIEYRLRALPG